ncbi:MAG: hypothetical protein JSW05_09385 [Candidatus Thorarchaeota archaeon]|nr:MAG: hypothetical protein JSW05_09385 [Candidatus Thorarchaeota archaeon]
MEKTESNDKRESKPLLVGILAALITVLAPAGFNVSFDLTRGAIMHVYLVFMLWTINLGLGAVNPQGVFQGAPAIPDTPVPIPLGLVGNLPLTFLRTVFVYQIYRYYQGKTTRNRAILAAAAGELQVAIVGLLLMMMPTFSLTTQLFIPIPILFLAGLVMIKMAPSTQLSTPWMGQEEPEPWWTQSSEDEESAVEVKEEPWLKKGE